MCPPNSFELWTISNELNNLTDAMCHVLISNLLVVVETNRPERKILMSTLWQRVLTTTATARTMVATMTMMIVVIGQKRRGVGDSKSHSNGGDNNYGDHKQRCG